MCYTKFLLVYISILYNKTSYLANEKMWLKELLTGISNKYIMELILLGKLILP